MRMSTAPWSKYLCGVAVMALVLLTGCGEEQKPPVVPNAPAAGMPAMPAGAPAAGATAAVTKVFACAHDNVFLLAAGECPKCKMALKEMPVANPDPNACVSTGEKIEKHNSFGIVNDKVYAFCCDMCMGDLKANPDAVVKKAQERADAAKAGK